MSNGTLGSVTIPPGPPPVPSTKGQIIGDVATAGVAVAEALDPALLAFNPLFALALVAIRAHFNATGNVMTLAQLQAAIGNDVTTLQSIWGAWTASKATPPTP